MTTCWGITDGSTGMVSQVRALAAALGLAPEMKTIHLKTMFSWQPNAMYAAGFKHLILDYALDTSQSDSLTEPWPDLVISCGRRAALIAMGMHHANRAGTRFIHIQDPHCPPSNYDLVVAMAHDKIHGPNVLKSHFALHSITPEVLATARAKFESRFAAYASPRVAVLIGGSTNKYELDAKAMRAALDALQAFQQGAGATLLITPSRRTGEENIKMLQARFAGNSKAFVYDGQGENPYMGMLALADAIIATNDSVNMMSDAHATGKPLYILPFAGHKKTKPARFAEKLIKDGIARPLGKTLEQWHYTDGHEMMHLAAAVKKHLGLT